MENGMIRLPLVLLMMCFLSFDRVSAQTDKDENPPAPGFNTAGSDEQAVKIADEVMNALGGRRNWDKTRYVTWRFFGRRLHVWDKWTGVVRVEFEESVEGSEEKYLVVVVANIHDKTGIAWKNGEPVTGEKLMEYVQAAYEMWINDSYWLVMPYKLKDTGVTLKYKGEEKMADGRPADVLILTFENVGVTPGNRYEVFVDKKTRLVEQWSFFENATDVEPGFTRPWAGWKKYGNIMLPESFGKRGHTGIAVFEELPAAVFEGPADIGNFLK